MKTTKKDKKLKPTLKVKKEGANGESSLNKAVKNVKKILKEKAKLKAAVKEEVKPQSKDAKVKKENKNYIKVEGIKAKKPIKRLGTTSESKVPKDKGLIYIGHIPHGFYEKQMKEFFSQFGKVTRVRVNRSQITGRSKGYGFVEFLHPEVAKIAAESMNNYLMSGRLVKAEYIPPERQHENYFKGADWSIVGHPALRRRKKEINRFNGPKPNERHQIYLKKSLKKFSKISQLLRNEGLDFEMKFGAVKV